MFLDLLWRYCFGTQAQDGTINMTLTTKGQSTGHGWTYHHMIQSLEYAY